MQPTYRYRAVVRRIIDGDTIEADVDLGFFVLHRTRLRLLGIDCPERFTPEGKAATAFVASYLPAGSEVVVESVKPDKYGGRWNATVWLAEVERSLNDLLLEAGHARPYPR